jgi:hypothetical protein
MTTTDNQKAVRKRNICLPFSEPTRRLSAAILTVTLPQSLESRVQAISGNCIKVYRLFRGTPPKRFVGEGAIRAEARQSPWFSVP